MTAESTIYLLQEYENKNFFLVFDSLNEIQTTLLYGEAFQFDNFQDALYFFKKHAELLINFDIVSCTFSTTLKVVDQESFQRPEYQTRVIEEKKEVETRLSNLNNFLNKGQPNFMSKQDWDLLNIQAFSMRSYVYILYTRIANFRKND